MENGAGIARPCPIYVTDQNTSWSKFWRDIEMPDIGNSYLRSTQRRCVPVARVQFFFGDFPVSKAQRWTY